MYARGEVSSKTVYILKLVLVLTAHICDKYKNMIQWPIYSLNLMRALPMNVCLSVCLSVLFYGCSNLLIYHTITSNFIYG